MWVLGMLGLSVGFGSHRETFVEEGLSRDALGVSIPLLLLSPRHEDMGADFLAKGSALCTHPWPSPCPPHIYSLYSSVSTKPQPLLLSTKGRFYFRCVSS